MDRYNYMDIYRESINGGGNVGLVTELRTTFLSTAHDPEYQCQQCSTHFDCQFHVCPECGSYRIERRDWQPTDI